MNECRTVADSLVSISIALALANSCAGAKANDGITVLHTRRPIGDETATVFEYEEPFGDVAPATGRRQWRTVLCVEVSDRDGLRGRRVWQRCQLGRRADIVFSPTSVVLSEGVDGRCLIAYCLCKVVFVGTVELMGEVEPLPSDGIRTSDRMLSPNGKNAAMLTIPEAWPVPGDPERRILRPIGRSEIGIDSSSIDEISLNVPTKTNNGWKIDATVYSTFDPVAQKFGRYLLTRFAILLDSECKSFTIEAAR